MNQKLLTFLTAVVLCCGAVIANDNRSLGPATNSIMPNGTTIPAFPGVPPGYPALPNGTPPHGSQNTLANPLDAVTFTYEGSTLYNGLQNVKVSGNYAFVTMPYGLQIIDISVSSAPIRVSQLYMPGARDIDVNGNYAYVTGWNDGGKLRIVDISNVAAPSIVGTCTGMWQWGGVQVVGNYAYMADEYSLIIIDVSSPTSPVLLSSLGWPGGNARDVQVVDTFAYVADGPLGLQIVNVADPASPMLVGSYDTPGFSQRVAVSGTLAFLADEGGGLQIVDISVPAAPTFVGNYVAIEGICSFLWVSGNIAYISVGMGGIQAIDVSVPSVPAKVGQYNVGGYNFSGDFMGAGNNLYITTGADLQIVNAITPSSLSLLGRYDTKGGAGKLAVSGNYVYVANADPDMSVVDVSDPQNPVLIGTYEESDGGYATFDIAKSGNLIYLAKENGLRILDVSIPSSPSLLGTADFCCVSGMDVSGNYAYLAANEAGLVIVDISNPAIPSIVSTFDTPFSARDVEVHGNIAFVADLDSGLVIIDVSNHAAPTLIARYQTPMAAYSVSVRDTIAYVGSYGANAIMAVSVSNPTSPTLVSATAVPGVNGAVIDIKIVGDFLFTCGGWYGGDVAVVDIADPAALTVVGAYATISDASGVAVNGNKVYVGDASGFLSLTTFADLDADGINDFVDNCPKIANPDQADADLDGIGDVCDPCTDTDGDGFGNPGYPANTCTVDNCPTVANPSQIDSNGNGIGDACDYICGDANADASVDISDAVYLIAYIFAGGPAPNPLAAGDANCDLAVDISDAVYLISYIFGGGPAPCAGCK